MAPTQASATAPEAAAGWQAGVSAGGPDTVALVCLAPPGGASSIDTTVKVVASVSTTINKRRRQGMARRVSST
jgi:hypothetical protein